MRNVLSVFFVLILAIGCQAAAFCQSSVSKNRLEIGIGHHWRKNNSTYDNGSGLTIGYTRSLNTKNGLYARFGLTLIDCHCQEFPYCPDEGEKFNYKIVDFSFGKQMLVADRHSLSASIGIAGMFVRQYTDIWTTTYNNETRVIFSAKGLDRQYTSVVTGGYRYFVGKDIEIGADMRYFAPINGRFSYSMFLVAGLRF